MTEREMICSHGLWDQLGDGRYVGDISIQIGWTDWIVWLWLWLWWWYGYDEPRWYLWFKWHWMTRLHLSKLGWTTLTRDLGNSELNQFVLQLFQLLEQLFLALTAQFVGFNLGCYFISTKSNFGCATFMSGERWCQWKTNCTTDNWSRRDCTWHDWYREYWRIWEKKTIESAPLFFFKRSDSRNQFVILLPTRRTNGDIWKSKRTYCIGWIDEMAFSDIHELIDWLVMINSLKSLLNKIFDGWLWLKPTPNWGAACVEHWSQVGYQTPQQQTPDTKQQTPNKQTTNTKIRLMSTDSMSMIQQVNCKTSFFPHQQSSSLTHCVLVFVTRNRVR